MLRFLSYLFPALILSASVFAQTQHNHAKHNMILFGESELFASHIVYKSPHNYQVILSLNLSPDDFKKYLAAKASHPGSQFIYLLDAMDIKDIESAPQISGSVFYFDSSNQKHLILPNLIVSRSDFKVIYFDELPLSLDTKSAL